MLKYAGGLCMCETCGIVKQPVCLESLVLHKFTWTIPTGTRAVTVPGSDLESCTSSHGLFLLERMQ